MSYYSSNFFSAHHCDYNPNIHCGTYDSNSTPPSSDFSYPPNYYEFNEPQFVKYENLYQYHHAQSLISYAVSNPNTLSISHSTTEFTDTEFDDYDPTPYGGGFDLAATYGKPLPPSDEICYPRSAPNAKPPFQDDSPDLAIDPPPRKEEIVEPTSQGIDSSKDDKEDRDEEPPPPQPQPATGVGDQLSDGGGDGDGERRGSDSVCDVDYFYPWCGYGENGFENWGRSEEIRGSDWETKVPEPDPFGYNPDAMDFCESLFGYWPCLYRKQRRNLEERQKGYDHAENCDGNQLRGAADYIFGDSRYQYGEPVGEGGGGGFGVNSVHHGHEWHCQMEQPFHGVVMNYGVDHYCSEFREL